MRVCAVSVGVRGTGLKKKKYNKRCEEGEEEEEEERRRRRWRGGGRSTVRYRWRRKPSGWSSSSMEKAKRACGDSACAASEKHLSSSPT